jgi:succinyl-diaminopimelate desuccinylase
MTDDNPTIHITRCLLQDPSITPKGLDSLTYVQSLLKDKGFKTEIVCLSGDNELPVYNLWAYYGTAKPHFCFAGHVDVVPVGDKSSWNHPPFDGVIDDNILYGRGAVDMKGGIGAFLGALNTIDLSALSGTISLLLTTDEEGPALYGTQAMIMWLKKQGHEPTFCLVGEPTSKEHIGDVIKCGRRGSLTGTLKVRGAQGHVAYPVLAENPVSMFAKVLGRLNDLVFDRVVAEFEPTNLEITGIKTSTYTSNVIPECGEALFNIRYHTGYTTDEIKGLIVHCVGSEAEINFMPQGSQPFLQTDNPYKALCAHAVEKITGRVPTFETGGGTSDARFLAAAGWYVLELGLKNALAHHVNECVQLDDLMALKDMYAQIIHDFFAYDSQLDDWVETNTASVSNDSNDSPAPYGLEKKD